jgi:putative transposase
LRFGIETSYRQMNQARIRTCAKDPAVRLLFVGVALVLRNVWVYLHYAILSTPRRGRRVLNLELLPLKEMLLWLLRVAEQEWGQVNTIETERHVETAFTCE